MKHPSLLAGALVITAGLLANGVAHADDIKGYTNTASGLQSGPGTEYPTVASVASGVNVDIKGCTQGFYWCDVSWNGNRGWIQGSFLDSIYKDKRESVSQYGSQQRVPTVVWEQKSYWNDNYRDRPFYSERRYWTVTPE